MKTTEQIMERLGYNHAWLEAGVISESLLREQWAVFQITQDQNAEHYRHGAFIRFLNQQTEFSDVLLEDLLALKDGDEHDMRVVRINEILLSKRLSKQQLQDFATRDELQLEASIQKIYMRQCVLEDLKQGGLTEAIFVQIQHSQDKYLHELLLTRADVSREHLLWLFTHGQSKAIRNRVNQMLKAEPYRTI